jgi:fructokinase
MSRPADAVVVWGEVLWDRFPDGDQLGGAPANVAWHLGQAGGWPQLVSRVGDDDDGRRAIERLAAFVDTDLIQVDRERATGEVTVQLVGGEARYTLHAGRAWERIECTPAVESALSQAGVFVYGTLSQRTAEGLAAWRQAIAAVTSTRVCDLNLRPGQTYSPAIGEALAAADILKVNDRELASLAEWLGWSDPIATLRDRGDAIDTGRPGRRIVVVTHGAAGSTIHGDHGAIAIAPVPATPGGDNVGCGDAYLAILVYGLTSGWDLELSGQAASRYAAAVAGARGATPIFDDDLLADLVA